MAAHPEAPNDSPKSSHRRELGKLTRFADELRPVALIKQQTVIKKRSRDLCLDLHPEEIVVYAALEEPPQVQDFIKNNLPYNPDASRRRESCRSPRQTLIKGSAHCFEGALFAFASNTLNRHTSARLVLLEARAGYDHNIVVYQDQQTKKWGCQEECGAYGSKGRPAKYKSIRGLAQSFSNDHRLSFASGEYYRFSDPIDLIARFGTNWITAPDSRYIYYHYIDQSVHFHPIFGTEKEPSYYPLVEALRNKWIVIGKRKRSEIAPENFPKQARPLWDKYLELKEENTFGDYDDDINRLSSQFVRLTGVTPLALEDQASDFQFFLREGYQPEELLIKMSKLKKSRGRIR